MYLLLPAEDLTVCMDIKSNPGPRSRISSTRNPLPLNVGGKTLHITSHYIQYSRSVIFKLRLCGNDLASNPLDQYTLANLKVNGLLRYRGKRAGLLVNCRKTFYIIDIISGTESLCGLRIPSIVSVHRNEFEMKSIVCRPRTLISINCKTNIITPLPTSSNNKPNMLKPATFILLDAQSIRNKTLSIKDYIVEHDTDFLALTETWLSPGNSDDQIIRELIPHGYSFIHVPRKTRGGGVGFVFKNEFCAKRSTENISSF